MPAHHEFIGATQAGNAAASHNHLPAISGFLSQSERDLIEQLSRIRLEQGRSHS
jgi:hypothetical protein